MAPGVFFTFPSFLHYFSTPLRSLREDRQSSKTMGTFTNVCVFVLFSEQTFIIVIGFVISVMTLYLLFIGPRCAGQGVEACADGAA